jgi:Tol biopolymer transport system component
MRSYRAVSSALLVTVLAAAASGASAQTTSGTLLLTRLADRVEIYTVREDGTQVRRVAESRIAAAPAWSPDGATIVFARARREPTGPDLWTVRADGSGARLLAGTPHADVEPAFSPDGRRVAFLTAATTRFLLQVVNADGSGLRQLFDSRLSFTFDWSPDSRRIVFSHEREGRVGLGDLSVVDVETGRIDRLTSGNARTDWPAWSPDGTMIAFGRTDRQDAGPTLHVMRADGRGVRELSNRTLTEPPAWAPNSRSLAFTGRRILSYARYGPVFATEVFSVDVDGSNERKLTAAGTETRPSWSSDGGRIAFTTAREVSPRTGGSTYVMNTDGSCESRVTGGVVWPRAWRPAPPTPRLPLACADLGLTMHGVRRLVGRRQPVTFVVRVRNDGNRPATNVVVRFAPGRWAQVVRARTGTHLCRQAAETRCALGTLPVGGAGRIEVVVRPRRAGAFVSRAWVRATEQDLNRSDNAAAVKTLVRA